MKQSKNSKAVTLAKLNSKSIFVNFLALGLLCSFNMNRLLAEPVEGTNIPMPTMTPPVSPTYIDTQNPIPTMTPPVLPAQVVMPVPTVMPVLTPVPPTMPCQQIFDRMNQIHATIMQERMNLNMISAQLNLETLMMNSAIESRSEFIELLANATDELAKIYYRSHIQILTDRIQSRQNIIEDLDYRESQKEIQISDLEAALERVRDQLRMDNCPNP